MKAQQVWVVLDTKGQGRVVGVFDHEAQAAEIQAVSSTYYRMYPLSMNAVNPDSVRWVQDEHGRQTLQRLSAQMTAIPDDAAAPASRPAQRIVAIAFAAGRVWQAVVIGVASRSVAALAKLAGDAGVTLPASSRMMIATHKLWLAAPLATMALFIFASRQSNPMRLGVTAAILALVLGLVFQVWADVALLAPLRDLIAKLG